MSASETNVVTKIHGRPIDLKVRFCKNLREFDAIKLLSDELFYQGKTRRTDQTKNKKAT
jgi:hypothetical protein